MTEEQKERDRQVKQAEKRLKQRAKELGTFTQKQLIGNVAGEARHFAFVVFFEWVRSGKLELNEKTRCYEVKIPNGGRDPNGGRIGG